MDIKAEHDRQLRLIEWIDAHLSREFPLPSRSLKLAHPCFDLVIEHHAAICLLEEAELFGSMYALIRVQLEALVNGLWLRHVAKDAELTKYEKEDRISFGARTIAIEQQFGIAGGFLSYLKKEQWDLFCSFTHAGHQAVVRRVSETHTGSVNYTPREVVTVLRQSGLFAVMAAVELSSMTGDQRLIEEAMRIAKGYGGNGL